MSPGNSKYEKFSQLGDIEIGARFISDEDHGTVRFVGEVPPTKGVWLGVEWDNPERGKHDGSRDGVQYFHCSSTTGGSFIRHKKADFGIDFLSALRERYVPDNVETADIDENDLFIRGSNNQITKVEMVGAAEVAKQQSTFSDLTQVAVRAMRISHIRGTQQLGQIVPCITELDLSQNLLPSWEVVSELSGQFKLLKTLLVSENRLQIPSNPSSLSGCFSNLQELFMNYMNLTLAMVAECAPMWPRLKSLHACYNQITTIDSLPPDVFKTLELLNLEGNQIKEWQHIMCFSQLPRLDTLILNSNSLSSIFFEDTPVTAKTKHFQNLKSLSISSNLLNSLQDTVELDKLACLTDLRTAKNPFTKDMASHDVREQLVARIGGLKRCYGTPVLEAERQWAEMAYVKKYCKDWLASGGSRQADKSHPSEAFLQLHSRFPKLLEMYGIPEESELIVNSYTLKDTLLSVTIKCPQDSTKKILTKKLPGTMEVQKLKSLIYKLLKVDVATQTLAYISHQVPDQEIKLDNDMRQISYYSIESGDQILVKW